MCPGLLRAQPVAGAGQAAGRSQAEGCSGPAAKTHGTPALERSASTAGLASVAKQDETAAQGEGPSSSPPVLTHSAGLGKGWKDYSHKATKDLLQSINTPHAHRLIHSLATNGVGHYDQQDKMVLAAEIWSIGRLKSRGLGDVI